MTSTPQDRLCRFIENKGLNIRRFEQLCSLSNGTVSKLGANPRYTVISKISTAFPDLNIDWLLTGEGNMLTQRPNNEIEELDQSELMKLQKDVYDGKATVVPLIPASAFAGDVKGLAPESISSDQCEMIVSPVNGAELAIPITGDSMEPDYPDGSLAYIKRINESAFIPWGHTVILDTENGAFIKRIYPDDANDEYIWAKSINPDYPPMHIPKSAIFRIFRVLGTSRIFTTM